MGVVANTTHIGAAGYHAERLAGGDMVGLAGAAGTPLMAYHGAAVPSVSTAPLAIAVPAADRPAIVFDMASSVAALGKIRQAARAGVPIPEGWALDEDGAPTTDPDRAAVLLPVGGAKGAGLALMLEQLTGVLSGAPILAATLAGGKGPHRQNAMVIAIDIARLRPLEDFLSDADALARALEAQPLAADHEAIRMPGARSALAREQAARQGVAVDAALLARLKAAAGQG